MKKTFNPPDAIERDYIRNLMVLSRVSINDVQKQLIPFISAIKQQFEIESGISTDGVRLTDSWGDMLDGIMFGLKHRAESAVNAIKSLLPAKFQETSKFNDGQFRQVIKSNTGFDIPQSIVGLTGSSQIIGISAFRNEPYLSTLMDGWIKENVRLIESIPAKFHEDIEGIIRRGVMSGQSADKIKEIIKSRYEMTDNRARFIATDQILKLNADLTKFRLQSAGLNRYRWKSRRDSRVRPEHAALDRGRKIWSFDDPPSIGNPGTPIHCRCVPEPVFTTGKK